MRSSRFLLVVLLVAAGLALVPVPGTAADDAFELRLGEPVFWEGPHIQAAAVGSRARCNQTGPCWRYTLDVTEPGWRLRVALGVVFPSADHVRPLADSRLSPHFGSFDLHLTGPNGFPTTTRSIRNGYDVEALVAAPTLGLWTVEVVPVEVVDLSFKLRALVQPLPEPPEEEELALPNLRVIPPFEIAFTSPTATYGPGTPAPGGHPTCMAEEYVEAHEWGFDPPTVCLRFSMGVENAGEGPLTLIREGGSGSTVVGPGPPVPVHQRSQILDPTVAAWPYWRCCAFGAPGSAGEMRFHTFHLHYHYENVYQFELLAVTDPSWSWGPGAERPTLEHAGLGRKLGVAPVEERITDWDLFIQHEPNCCWTNNSTGLAPGWGDIYEWNRGGNYVDFPVDLAGQPVPGYYVLRGTTDPLGLIDEADEDDNHSYAFIEVTPLPLRQVRTLERGYGADPWDDDKKVLLSTP